MPVFDYLKTYADGIAAVLGVGEEPLAMASASLTFGDNRLEQHGERNAGEVLAGGSSPANSIDWDKLLGRATAIGEAGSYAYRLFHELGGAGKYCLVTDRRLLLLRSQREGGSFRFEPLLAIPRDSVAGARVQARGFSRGRVVVGFADGSAIALHTGMVERSRARQLAHALTHGQAES